MTRTPVGLSLLMAVILVTGSLLLSACQTPKPKVDEPAPESASEFQMVNGVFMRVNELPSKAETRDETRKKLELERIHRQVIEQPSEN